MPNGFSIKNAVDSRIYDVQKSQSQTGSEEARQKAPLFPDAGGVPHQNGFFSNHLDVLPADALILFPAQQPQPPQFSIHHNGRKLGGVGVKLYVSHKPKPCAVLYADDLFPVKLFQPANHAYPLLLLMTEWIQSIHMRRNREINRFSEKQRERRTETGGADRLYFGNIHCKKVVFFVPVW